MASRESLSKKLKTVPSIKKVYFQPPESVKMEYDCIRYSKLAPDIRRADDRIYKSYNKYELIHITRDPDSKVPEYIMGLFPMCRIERTYIADNLYHTVLTLYY